MEIRSVARFVEYYAGIRQRTMRVIACIPDARMEWRPSDGAFSFGDTIRHLAALERFMFAENAAGRPSSYPGHGPDLAADPAAVRVFITAMHEQTLSIISELTDDDLDRHCITPAGAPISVWKWLRAMVEHEVHHRGQIYLMLRLVGVETPPIFGLTSEQVRAHSSPSV